jgi:cytochrome c-type biogenesis protein CcmH/NrfG
MDQAITIKPTDAETWFLRGTLLVFYGRPREALASFAEAHRLGHPSAAAMIQAMQNRDAGPEYSGGAL